jgi:hypothetical protein
MANRGSDSCDLRFERVSPLVSSVIGKVLEKYSKAGVFLNLLDIRVNYSHHKLGKLTAFESLV